VGLLVIPEDGEEEDVSWMEEWAARHEVEEQLEVRRQKALQDKMQLLQRQNKLLQARRAR
jgi:hypothetical protein